MKNDSGQKILSLWRRPSAGKALIDETSLTLVTNGGVLGDYAYSTKRQITILFQNDWSDALGDLGGYCDPRNRRANILLSGSKGAVARGARIAVGNSLVEIKDILRPCAKMDAAIPGLKNSLKVKQRSGFWGTIEQGGKISIGDPYRILANQTTCSGQPRGLIPNGLLSSPIDHDGFIVNISCHQNIDPCWNDLLREIVDQCLAIFGDQIYSICLRGSLPRGCIIPGSSDIDTAIILHHIPSIEHCARLEAARRDLLGRHRYIKDIELTCATFQQLLHEDKYVDLQFLLSVDGLRLYGSDIISSLPRFRLDKDAARLSIHLKALLPRAMRALQFLDDLNAKEFCAWIMKILTRSSFEIVMKRENIYTRDIQLCWEIFSRHHPDKSAIAQTALALAINPVSTKKVIAAVLRDFGGWLADTAIDEFAHNAN